MYRRKAGMLKVHVQNLKSRIFDKVHLKVCLLDKNPLLRGWKLLEFKWQLKWGNETALRLANQTTKVNKWYRHHPRHSFLNLFIDLFYVHLGACIHYKLVLLLQWPRWKVALNALFSTGRQIASHADVLRCPSRVPASRTSAEPKDKFLSHCSQVSAGDHMQIIGEPIDAVESQSVDKPNTYVHAL